MSQRGQAQDQIHHEANINKTRVQFAKRLFASTFCVSVSFPAGGGVGAVREGGGGAPGIRQPSPAADRRPMSRHFGASGQRSGGGQLLTLTHTERRLLGPLTPNTLKMFPLLSTSALNKAFSSFKASCFRFSRVHCKYSRVYRLVGRGGTESDRDRPSAAPAAQPTFGFANRT